MWALDFLFFGGRRGFWINSLDTELEASWQSSPSQRALPCSGVLEIWTHSLEFCSQSHSSAGGSLQPVHCTGVRRKAFEVHLPGTGLEARKGFSVRNNLPGGGDLLRLVSPWEQSVLGTLCSGPASLYHCCSFFPSSSLLYLATS